MTTTTTFLKNASARHAVFLNRFSGGQLKKLLPHLERIKKLVSDRLSRKDLKSENRARLQAVYKDLTEKIDVIYKDMKKELKQDMRDFAKYEAEFSKKMFEKASNAEFVLPSESIIKASVFRSGIELISDDVDIDGAIGHYGLKKRQQIMRTIKDGVVVGLTNQEITDNVDSLVSRLQRREAATLVSTIVNHVSTSARKTVIDENEDVVKGYRWVSTLDGDTTETCRALDGKFIELDDKTAPPLHWNCRSVLVPVVKDEYNVTDNIKTERPAVGSDGAEQVDSRTTYNSWLKKQPKEFQEEVLGQTKAKLFRDGGLQMKDFVDANYKPLTLEQLKRKQPMAFSKAGIDLD